jgi:hypothetical protein
MAMNGKTGIFITACWITMALSCGDACAQDTGRVPDTNPQAAAPVDASIQAGVEEARKPQPQPQRTKKPPASYSKWGFQSANQASGNQFRPAPATTSGPSLSTNAKNLGGPSVQAETQPPALVADSAKTRATDLRSRKPDRQSNLFGVSSANNQRDRLTGRQLFETQIEPLSAQPASREFETPFREKQFGRIGDSSFPNAFLTATHTTSQDKAKGKQHKPLPLKAEGKPHAGAIIGSSKDQGKKGGSRSSAKPE